MVNQLTKLPVLRVERGGLHGVLGPLKDSHPSLIDVLSRHAIERRHVDGHLRLDSHVIDLVGRILAFVVHELIRIQLAEEHALLRLLGQRFRLILLVYRWWCGGCAGKQSSFGVVRVK